MTSIKFSMQAYFPSHLENTNAMGIMLYKQFRTIYISCNYKDLSLCFFAVSITGLRILFPKTKKAFMILQVLYFLKSDQLQTRKDMVRTFTAEDLQTHYEKKLRKQLSLKVAAVVKSQYFVNMQCSGKILMLNLQSSLNLQTHTEMLQNFHCTY